MTEAPLGVFPATVNMLAACQSSLKPFEMIEGESVAGEITVTAYSC
jgi:hypothetical protein